MPGFKPKTNKKIIVNEKSTITVDTKHQQILNDIQKLEQLLPALKTQRKSIIKKMTDKKHNNSLECIELRDTLSDITKQIQTIKCKRKKYFLDNSKFVFRYFENKKQICKNDNKKKVLNTFFKLDNTNLPTDSQTNTNIVRQYLTNVDEQFLDIDDYIENHSICEICNGELIPVDHEGIVICNKCGTQHPYLVEHDKPSYKEPPKEICFYAYKRINHFREILAQFQAKESTQIEDDVMDNIQRQIKKERITMDQLTNEKTKQILKNLGYNKYYEHIPFIKNKLGIKPPTMSIELENTLCNLFLEIQKPYAKYCPNQRVNFLNYYYVLYKMCELLGEDQYLSHFCMLKDPIKRMEQDDTWKKICAELQWEFIPTP